MDHEVATTPDEELPQPRRGSRLQWTILALAVLVAAGLGVVRAVAQRDDNRPSGAPTSSASRLDVDAVPAVAVPERLQLPATCPWADDGLVACRIYRGVSPQFAAAVHALLPGVRTRLAITKVLRATRPEVIVGIWSRQFAGGSGGRTIRVVVHRGHTGAPTAQVSFRSGRVVVYARTTDRLYTVEVEVGTPSGSAPSLAAVQRLAADHRLVRDP